MDNLSQRLASGEPAAYAELYDACADRLFHWLSMHLRSASDAEDVVQETFARLARSRHALRNVENPISYVFTIARNEVARYRTRRRRREEAYRESALARSGYGNEAAAAEARDAVQFALARLPEEQREIVELKAFGGLTLREIAETTGLPPGTVATRYRAGLERLRTWLARNECHD